MSKGTHLEFKVGMFVLIALIGLIAFIFSVSDSSVFEEGKSIRIVFGYANGVKISAPVRIAGVEKGNVRDIKLFFDREEGKTKVEIELKVKKDLRIPADSLVMINQLGLMGEKYVEIIPGQDNKNFFEEDQIYFGRDPIPQEIISLRVMEVAGDIEQTISGIRRFVGSEVAITHLENTVKNFSEATDNLSAILNNLEQGNGTIGRLIKDDKLYLNMEGLTADLGEVLHNLKDGQGTVGKLLYDDDLYDNLEAMTADLKENPWKLLYRDKKNKKKK
ncbi:MAG: MlaD family protein [Candidatus Omnitrophica bacterium]|nr:MlaD family protein [Candidatus Omnitrophota bacterium]